jgi:hypothetical protein
VPLRSCPITARSIFSVEVLCLVQSPRPWFAAFAGSDPLTCN